MTSLLILSSILLYIYIANVNSNRSLFQSLVQHSLSRKLYRIAEYIFVVGKRLNDGWKINSEVVLVRKPSSFLFLKKLVPFIYRNNRIFTNHGFVMHVQNPGIGKLIDQTLEICTYIYIYISMQDCKWRRTRFVGGRIDEECGCRVSVSTTRLSPPFETRLNNCLAR